MTEVADVMWQTSITHSIYSTYLIHSTNVVVEEERGGLRCGSSAAPPSCPCRPRRRGGLSRILHSRCSKLVCGGRDVRRVFARSLCYGCSFGLLRYASVDGLRHILHYARLRSLGCGCSFTLGRSIMGVMFEDLWRPSRGHFSQNKRPNVMFEGLWRA